MDPLTITIQRSEVSECFAIKEVKDAKLTINLLHKKIQSTDKVIFILLCRSSLLRRLYHLRLKITREAFNLSWRSLGLTTVTDENLEVQDETLFYYAFDNTDSNPYSFKIYLQHMPVKSNFKLLSTSLVFNYPLPDSDNHDVILLPRPEPELSDINENEDNHENNEKRSLVLAHKHILVFHSQFFSELFKDVCNNTTNLKTKSCITPEYNFEFCSHKVLQFIVNFMYTGIPTLSSLTEEDSEFWIKVLNYSVEWNVIKLQPLALFMCYTQISTGNARDILQLGLNIHEAPDILAFILDFVKDDWLYTPKK